MVFIWFFANFAGNIKTFMNKLTSQSINPKGLTDAQVAESRLKYGDNILTPPKHVSLWKLYIEKYCDPIIQILLVAAAVSLVLAFVENDFLETIGIILAVFIATTVGFYFEMDAARKFKVLTAVNEDQPVKVRRNGRVTEVPRRDVVVGDIILIEAGDEIPADGELIEAVNLQVDESSLTGEQLTSKAIAPSVSSEGKHVDVTLLEHDQESTSETRDENHVLEAYPAHVVLRSSMVMNGHGVAVVTHVGDGSEIGKVATSSTEKTGVKTPLNAQLDKLAKLISKVGIGVALAAFVIFLTHDILTNSLWQGDNYVAMAHVVLGYFMMAVTLIVMAVPEGLPMAVTLSLALNMRRMLKSNNLVRKLHASETMGAVTVICTDKTGTLTQNQMTVGECVLANGTSSNQFYHAIAANTTAHLDDAKGVGNPTEIALLKWLKDQGQDYMQLRNNVHVTDQLPFSTENKYMMTVVDNKILYVKGAPEIVLAMCDIPKTEREEIEDKVDSFQKKGMRVLVLAMGEENSFVTSGLTFQGVFAIEDPVREDVPAAVMSCRKAGIEVKVVTGDNSATAIEIARQIGIWDEGGENEEGRGKSEKRRHITGVDFAALSDEEAYECVKNIRVMSRARPSDKQRLVELLQKRGEVVAVTGDGTNDAPALNYAHVGLSLGSGTSVAKEASDITLLDDSFHSITSAVMWGRSLYRNIQRFLFFQLVVNLSALLLVLGGAFIGTEMPLTVTQILWVNLIMDTFAAMALASLPPSREVMSDKPRGRSEFIISRPMGQGIVSCGLIFFVVMFVFLFWCERHGVGNMVDIHELTLFFTTFVMLQFWNLFNAKCLGSRYSAFRYLWRDRGLLLVLSFILVGQWLIVTFGGKMFRTQPLSLAEWGTVIGITGVFVFGGGELFRAFKRLRIRA